MNDYFSIVKPRSNLNVWFERSNDDSLKLYVSPMTKSLIDFHFCEFVASAGGWQYDQFTRSYLNFNKTISLYWENVRNWLEAADRFLWPGLNSRISNYYDYNVVDACMALDYNYYFDGKGYTPWGALESDAKYRLYGESRLEAVDKLISGMLEMVKFLPVRLGGDCVVSSVPVNHGEINFGRTIADEFAKKIGCSDMTPVLQCGKSKNKQMNVRDSYNEWEAIYRDDSNFVVPLNVSGKTVIIVDDLYQSGVSVWSYARFLKEHGATAVYALCCVKSIHDGRDGLQ